MLFRSQTLNTPGTKRGLGVSLSNLGDLARERGDAEQALAYFEESLDIHRELAQILGTPEAKRNLSVSLMGLGVMAHERGDAEQALAHFQESLDIRHELLRIQNTLQDCKAVFVLEAEIAVMKALIHQE